MKMMSREEIIYKISLNYKKNKSHILNAIKGCNGEVSIVEFESGLDDFYENDDIVDISLYYDNNCVKCSYFSDEIILEIIKNLPRKLKKLTISERVANLINFSEFDIDEVIIVSRNFKDGLIMYNLFHDEKIKRVGNICYDYYFLKGADCFDYIASDMRDEDVLNLLDEYKAYVYDIDFGEKHINFKFDVLRDGVVDIQAHFKDMSNVIVFADFLRFKGYVLGEVNLFSHDLVDIDYVNQDYSLLDEFSKSNNLTINMPFSGSVMKWYEFRGLVECIKWYRQLINDYDLSEVEKLAFAYDILKTFEYNEEKKEDDTTISREPQKIIYSGNIVCVGYAKLLCEMLRGIDPNIQVETYTLTCFEDNDVVVSGRHMRNIVRIHDDKYNIHGIYSLDVTWDSFRRKYSKIYGEEYNALDLYRYFLIPFTKYNDVFLHEERDSMFFGELDYLNDDLTFRNIRSAISRYGMGVNDELFSTEINRLFCPGESVFKVLSEFNSLSVSRETLEKIIYNVRMAQGYSESDALRKANGIICKKK